MAGGITISGPKQGRAELYEGRITAYVVLACIVAATGGSLFGYDLGVSGKFSSQNLPLFEFSIKIALTGMQIVLRPEFD